MQDLPADIRQDLRTEHEVFAVDGDQFKRTVDRRAFNIKPKQAVQRILACFGDQIEDFAPKWRQRSEMPVFPV